MFECVKALIIFIKSDQLYGKLDPDTKSWSDGVIAIIMRLCA